MPHVRGTGLDTEVVFYFTLAELKVSGQGKAGRPIACWAAAQRGKGSWGSSRNKSRLLSWEGEDAAESLTKVSLLK